MCLLKVRGRTLEVLEIPALVMQPCAGMSWQPVLHSAALPGGSGEYAGWQSPPSTASSIQSSIQSNTQHITSSTDSTHRTPFTTSNLIISMELQDYEPRKTTLVGAPAASSSRQPATHNNIIPKQSLQLRLQKRLLAHKPASQLDNFYTPKNDFFYSKSPYLGLDSKRREIRLIKVSPRRSYAEHIKANPKWAPINSDNGQPLTLSRNALSNLISSHRDFDISDPQSPLIACELVDKVPLSKVDCSYCTLSYFAGKPTETALILVDGLPFNAFANLEHALEHALNYWTSRNPEKDLLLWVDQICINQRDHVERASQVGMMRDIYRRSDETLICLSTPHSADCLAWIPRDPPGKSGVWSSPVGARENFNAVYKLKRELRERLLPTEMIYLGASTRAAVQKDTDSWFDSLLAFFGSHWWRRSWVYQEFIASHRFHFLSGSVSVHWTKLFPLVEWVCSDLDEFLDSMIAELKDGKRTYYVDHNTRQNTWERSQTDTQGRLPPGWERREYDPRRSEKKKILKTLESQRKHVTELIDLIKMQSQANEAINNCEKRRKNGGSFNLKSKFDEMRSTYIQRQFLRGISPVIDGLKSQITSLRQSGSSLWHEDLNTQLRELNKLRRNLDIEYKYHISNTSQRKIERIETLQNRFRALNLSTVSSMLEGKKNARKASDLKVLLRHSRNCDASDPRDRVYAFLGLAHKAYAIVPDYSAENTVAHVLMNIARKIIENERTLSILEHVHHGRDKLGSFLPTWVPDWTSREVDCGLNIFLNSDPQYEPFNASKGLPAKAEFRIDETNEANLDLKVQGVLIDVLYEHGNSIPNFPSLQLFKMPSGLWIITPKSALLEDEVWVFYGASKPVLLRPEGDNMYGFLGEVLVLKQDGAVSDIMFGSMIELVEQGRAETKEIWLV